MPCEILLKNTDSVNETLSEDMQRSILLKRGYPVLVRDYPHEGWSVHEGLPKYVILRITDATAEEVINYMKPYEIIFDWSVVSSVLPNDIWRLKLEAINVNSTGLGQVDINKVGYFLTQWNCAVVSSDTNEAVFDIAVFEDARTATIIDGALKSIGFWGRPIQNLELTDTYTEATGLHKVKIDFTSFMPNYVDRQHIFELLKSIIVQRGGTIVYTNIDIETIEFEILRTSILEAMKQDLKSIFKTVVWKRRYYLNTVGMDALVNYSNNNAGAPMEVTKAVAINYFIDRQLE